MRTVEFTAFYGNDDTRSNKRVCIVISAINAINVDENGRVKISLNNFAYTLDSNKHTYDGVMFDIQNALA